jgi:hypothetical protein
LDFSLWKIIHIALPQNADKCSTIWEHQFTRTCPCGIRVGKKSPWQGFLPVLGPFHTYSFVYHWLHIKVTIECFVKWNTAVSSRRTLFCGLRTLHSRVEKYEWCYFQLFGNNRITYWRIYIYMYCCNMIMKCHWEISANQCLRGSRIF